MDTEGIPVAVIELKIHKHQKQQIGKQYIMFILLMILEMLQQQMLNSIQDQ
jgi:hypothetical protein